MLEIKVSFLSALIDIVLTEELVFSVEEGASIDRAFEILIEKFGKEFENRIYNSIEGMNKYILVSLNGKDIRLQNNLATKLQNGDEISLLPVIAGG